MVQYFMLVAVVTVLIIAALTLNNVGKIKKETVPSLQTQDVVVDVTTATTGLVFEGSFVQPANSRITAIIIVPLAAISSNSAAGSVGYKAGLTTGGVDLVAAVATGLGSTAAAVPLTITTPSLVAAGVYTSVSRTVYLDVTATAALTTAGVVRYVVSYQIF